MSDECTSLLFQLNNKSAIYDYLKYLSFEFYDVFECFLLYVGPVLVVANIFAIFILSRKEQRTPYNLIFLVMALNQGLSILCIDIQLWSLRYEFGCGYFNYYLPSSALS
ncbi:hypothetical protein PMAYCL1PPCAC_31755 [Pristionchus mayeri]|uniref:G protein-coupled receptor n=1 Tax=Pristionchus mayeri TaxID=1317129 RepID=A0AAN5IEV7_9BILA|nr:hypothetical protein PMAYCL1PPCAC_31755 [Pristionchus mayeri]